MKKILLPLLLLPLSLLSSEKISLCAIPWTDASWFWTWDGQRLPVKDKNLFGEKITIAGKKYKTGLAGHTGFSAAYNLSGKALSFTAYAGIDDRDHKRDKIEPEGSSVRIIILVDRKEVFRKTVRLGEKAVRLDIPLKGKYQLELRGTYGKGFTRQRVVFADPVLEVESAGDFIKQAKKWPEKINKEKKLSPEYPPAPQWKNIKIEKIKYDSFKNSYKISNGKIEFTIVPEYGGRIMTFNLKTGKNILKDNGKLDFRHLFDRGFVQSDGGHFSRPKPKNYFIPCDPLLLSGKYTVEFPEEGRIVLTSPKSWLLFLRYKYEITVKPGVPGVEITTSHENIAPFRNKAGIWSITRMKNDIVKALMIPPEMKNPPEKSKFTPSELSGKIIKTSQWDIFNISSVFLKRLGTRDSIQWQQFSQRNEIKVITGSCSFTKKFTLDKNDLKLMDGFFPAHFYFCDYFLEAECHGPVRELAPGKKISFKETWYIHKSR